ncbi:MAG TPA: PilZ domain-containing protein [Candidatus Goldiibacteriota bacterium]|nr:PilZ domain-containing protein [Candidatus Goldiibacteriota bacterium]
MPHGEIFSDKRKHPRIEKKLKVAYKLMKSSGEDVEKFSDEKRHVMSGDISICGIQLLCDEPFKFEDVLRLDIYIEGEKKPLATFAEVKWIKKDESLGKYRLGLEFLVLKEDHIDAIKRLDKQL